MQSLVAIRDSPATLALLLAAINAMNVMDLVLTYEALQFGHGEGNPVMAVMFSYGPLAAAGFKILTVAAVTLIVWRMRGYRKVLQVAVSAFALYVGIVVLHMYGHLFEF